MLIRKVKFKDGRTFVRGEDVDHNGEVIRSVEVNSYDPPRAEFMPALLALKGPALELIGAPSAWRDGTIIGGLSVNYEDDGRMGAVVTLLVPLDTTNSPLVLNTPHLRAPGDPDEGGRFMPYELERAVEEMVKEAGRYLDGERAQGDLFKAGEMEPAAL